MYPNIYSKDGTLNKSKPLRNHTGSARGFCKARDSCNTLTLDSFRTSQHGWAYFQTSDTLMLNANRADSDQTPRSAASDLGLHCLRRSHF